MGSATVFVDPFDAAEFSRGRGFTYAPIQGADADVVLVTHDHTDHNDGIAAIGGDPQVVRTAGVRQPGSATWSASRASTTPPQDRSSAPT